VQVEQVREDGGREPGGEVDQCGPPAGLGGDAERSEPFCEPGGADRAGLPITT
jgi:hypothetical protein